MNGNEICEQLIIHMRDIPLEKLFKDKGECVTDIEICKWALLQGVMEYRNGRSAQERLDTNEGMIKLIDEELGRRRNELQG